MAAQGVWGARLAGNTVGGTPEGPVSGAKSPGL